MTFKSELHSILIHLRNFHFSWNTIAFNLTNLQKWRQESFIYWDSWRSRDLFASPDTNSKFFSCTPLLGSFSYKGAFLLKLDLLFDLSRQYSVDKLGDINQQSQGFVHSTVEFFEYWNEPEETIRSPQISKNSKLIWNWNAFVW